MNMTDANQKSIYISGPLTELSPENQISVKKFYERLTDICKEVTGTRAFVSHEYYDPLKNPDYTPQQVDAAERKQLCDNSSLVIAVPVAPSWGGGIEIEMANTKGVPVILLCEEKRLAERKISRLLLGNPAVRQIIIYQDEQDAFTKIKKALQKLYGYGKIN